MVLFTVPIPGSKKGIRVTRIYSNPNGFLGLWLSGNSNVLLVDYAKPEIRIEAAGDLGRLFSLARLLELNGQSRAMRKC